MKEIVTYKYDSFIDYKGQEHKIIVCAVSRRVNADICLDNVVGYIGGVYRDIPKILSFGVAICNPTDQYNQTQGEKMAYGRAINYSNDNCPTLLSSHAGFFNDTTVKAIMDNYIEYIKRDPGSVINGYDAAKKKYIEEKELKEDISKMPADYKDKLKFLATCTPDNIKYAKKVLKFIS